MAISDHVVFCAGMGRGDTRKEVFENGRNNSVGGQPYATVMWADVLTEAVHPPTVDKTAAPWLIPSTYSEWDGREHAAQRRRGEFRALWADIDTGNPTLAEVVRAVAEVVGVDVEFLIYSSRGSTADHRKWRVLVPIVETMPGSAYSTGACAFNNMLEAHGLSVDRVTERPGQLCYRPNRGAFYEHHVAPGQRLRLEGHPLQSEARRLLAEQYAEAAKEVTQRQGSMWSPIASFNRKHRTEDLLLLYWFETRDGVNWHHSTIQTTPRDKTKGATRLYPDGGWSTLSESVIQTLGRKSGDAFDLYTHFNCAGDKKAALAYAEECRAVELFRAARHGEAIWSGVTHVNGVPINVKDGSPAFPGALSFDPITEDEWWNSPLSPACIVDRYLYADVGIMIAAGGVGKTSLMLYEAIHIVLGWPLYGRKIKRPGPVAILSAEDDRSLMAARLRHTAEMLFEGRPSDGVAELMRLVRENVLIAYVGGQDFRLCTIKDDTVTLSPKVLALVNLLQEVRPVLFVIDPAVSFGVGEQRVNDAEQGLINACRKIRDSLEHCCVRLIHHTGKGNARDQTLDQYSGRGGSAMADGARMVAVLQPRRPEDFAAETGFSLEEGETGLVMALPKVSHCPPQEYIYIRRKGFAFKHTTGTPVTNTVLTEDELGQLKEIVRAKWATGDFEQYPRENNQAAQWFGHDVADLLGWDTGRGGPSGTATPAQKQYRSRVKKVVAQLLLRDFDISMQPNAKGDQKKCVNAR